MSGIRSDRRARVIEASWFLRSMSETDGRPWYHTRREWHLTAWKEEISKIDRVGKKEQAGQRADVAGDLSCGDVQADVAGTGRMSGTQAKRSG